MTFQQLHENILGGNLQPIKNIWETYTPFSVFFPQMDFDICVSIMCQTSDIDQ